jgi:hypothetical protein
MLVSQDTIMATIYYFLPLTSFSFCVPTEAACRAYICTYQALFIGNNKSPVVYN